MRKALGLAVVLAALAGGCGGGDGESVGGRSDGGGGSAADGGGAAGEGTFPTACPTAEDVGGRVGLAMELEHNGFVLGDAELLCSYEYGDHQSWSASRSRNEDVQQARDEYHNGVFFDGAPAGPDDPTRSRDLDLGDEAFVDSFADPNDDDDTIYGRARVRVGVRVCAFEGIVDAPGTVPPAEFEDAEIYLVSTLCGLGDAPAGPPGVDESPASGDPAAGTGCPAAAELGDRLGQDLQLESMDANARDLFCTYDGSGDGVFTGIRAMWFEDADPAGAAGRYEFDTVDPDDSPEVREGVTTTPVDLGDAAQVDVSSSPDDEGGYHVRALAAVLSGTRVCEAEVTGTLPRRTLASEAEDAFVWVITRLCGL